MPFLGKDAPTIGNYQLSLVDTQQNTLTPMNQSPVRQDDSTLVDWASELDRNESWLRAVIAARCREPQAVDEVMQEVAMAVVKQNSPLKETSKVKPWLYQIAVRQSLMYRRKHGRRRNMEHRYAEQIETRPRRSAPQDPLDWLIASERQSLIRDGIARLNPKDAELLLLKYTQDWTYRQIAEHLGTTASAVESRLHRARRNMRRQMVALEVIETK